MTAIYFVKCRLGRTLYWRERVEGDSDKRTLVHDLITGQFDRPVAIFEADEAAGTWRDVSKEIAAEVLIRASASLFTLGADTLNFIQCQLGVEATQELEDA